MEQEIAIGYTTEAEIAEILKQYGRRAAWGKYSLIARSAQERLEKGKGRPVVLEIPEAEAANKAFREGLRQALRKFLDRAGLNVDISICSPARKIFIRRKV